MGFHLNNFFETNRSVDSLLLSVVKQGPCPVMITDRKGLIVYVNEMFTELTGYSPKEALGQNPRVLKSSQIPTSVYEELWRVICSGAVWTGELCNRKKNGEEFWGLISIRGIKDKNGAISHFASVWQDSTSRKINEAQERVLRERLETQSRTDDLTGLFNRRHIFSELEREIARAVRYKRRLSGMMIDVDNFKQINDQHGHPTGDLVLRTFARILVGCTRATDILGRYGGDEFILILPETDLKSARVAAERIRKTLDLYQENVLGNMGVVTVSMGLVSFDETAKIDRTTFVDRIDQVLLAAKRAGKNTIVVG